MPSEKPPETLSLYLRDQANKFYPFYPQPKEPTRLPLEDQRESREAVNWALEQTLDRFLTFVPNSNALQNEHWVKPTVLDDVLCRLLLRDVPQMVQHIHTIQKTLEKNQLVLPEPKAEFWTYLRESAKCLIFGLSQASVALARAAMESCLRETYAHWFGKEKAYARETTLNILIEDLYRNRPVLSQEEIKGAREVQGIGDKVLHHQPVTPEQAFRAFEAARLVIWTRASKANH